MCDYSLHNVQRRDAKLADELITTAFRGTGTRGMADISEPQTAVCLRPGTELCFEGFKKRRWLGPLFSRALSVGTRAIFRKVDQDYASSHHDAIELDDGKIVLVTHLAAGQRVRVLQLPAKPTAAKPTAETQPAEMFGFVF